MPTINGRACVVDGRNLYQYPKAIRDDVWTNNGAKVTLESFDSTTNMWHIIASQGTGGMVGIYLPNYASGKIPDNTDWSYSADAKGIGKIQVFGIEAGPKSPPIGTIGKEWSRIGQIGHVNNDILKTIVMYFDTTDSPVDVYIKLPKLEIGKIITPLKIDKVFSDGKQVYGRNLIRGSYDSSWGCSTNGDPTIEKVTMDSGEVVLHVVSTKYGGIWAEFGLPSGNYNLSIEVKGTGVFKLGWESISDNTVTLTSDWQRVSRFASLDDNWHAFICNGEMDIYIRLLKVEKDAATPWTPAPEDVM